ncbi:MAG: DNA methyltransferase [Pirellulales bacterium]
MTQKLEKLKTLLKELFQLDQPDLDFGLYRIMHAKAAEVTQFLERDLLPQVQQEFSRYKTADKAELENELAKAIEQANELGADPESLPKVKELRAKLADDAVDLDALEGEVYDHLYGFFRRYYSEGDFLSKRVYKPGVYAIPYEGEEVKLHWANADQYYIKTSEYLRDYAFRLRPDDDANPMRVHFRLVQATEGEHGNVKAVEGKDRVFVLAPGDFIGEDDDAGAKELVIRFEYRPATLTDWPDVVREGKKKPPSQKELVDLAERRVLAANDTAPQAWLTELAKTHIKVDGEQADYSRLRAHLNRYVARNTFDYFIHKDLGTFLRRELDFFIKNEVMHLDDVESESIPRVEQYLSTIKVIRRLAGKIINFLAQLEDFQKKLWLKKKFVVETQYCIAIGSIPETFYEDIAANEAQREEWVRLCAIDDIQGDLTMPQYTVPLKPAFLAAHPTLVVDTQHFPADFVARLLDAIGDVGQDTDGVLINSENFQALALMQAPYKGQVKCIYIDPPYNTHKDVFPYKDGYKHGSWLSMISDRVILARHLLCDQGVLFSSIDGNEAARLHLLLGDIFGFGKHIGDLVWRNARDNNPTRIATEHEYIACYATNPTSVESVWKNDFSDPKELLLSQWDSWKEQNLPLDEMQRRLRQFIRDNSEALGEVDRYKFVDAEGIFTGSQSVHNPHPNGYEYDILHPITKKPMRMPGNGYRFPEETMRRDFIEKDRLIYGPDENRIVQIKLYLRDYKDSLRSVIELDGRLGAYALTDLFGRGSCAPS